MSKGDTKRPYMTLGRQHELTSVKTIDLTSLIPVYEMVFEPDEPPKQQSYAHGPITITAMGDITIDAVSGMMAPDTASVVGVTIDKALTAKPKTWAMSGTLQMDAKDSQALADALSALPQQCSCGHDLDDHDEDDDAIPCNVCMCQEYGQC